MKAKNVQKMVPFRHRPALLPMQGWIVPGGRGEKPASPGEELVDVGLVVGGANRSNRKKCP